MSEVNKPLCVVRAPVQCRAGYGDMSRDIIRHIIEYDKFDVKVWSVAWGDTPMNALDENNPKDKMILDRILKTNLNRQPDLFITITIPSEFQRLGKFNIGITAGIETTQVSAQWLEACNTMDAVFTISEHSKRTFTEPTYEKRDQAGNVLGRVKLEKPIEVLHNCIDTNIFKYLEYEIDIAPAIKSAFTDIKEDFCFLFVGHWLRGEFNEDRKNVSMLVKLFLETFKRVPENKPALILKTSSAGFSILDREEIERKVNQIRNSVTLEEGQTLPNIYLLHGSLTDVEMNSLYNHPKVKAHISFTKGEGFGRPLLEASVSRKPVIASGWSGHLDFLNPEEAVLVGGEIKQIHPSAVWENILIPESGWFTVDPNQGANAMAMVYSNYNTHRKSAVKLAKKNSKEFSYETIRARTFELLDKYVPEFAVPVPIVLPKLKKINLPQLGTENGTEK